MNSGAKRILHIITSTSIGGAETVLFNLLVNSHSDHYTHQVLSLAPLGDIGLSLQQHHIPHSSLNMNNSKPSLTSFLGLLKAVKRSSADLVHCWMYHANLLGGIAAFLAGRPVIWSIHHHQPDDPLLKKSTIRIARLCARLSRWLPDRIIYCAQSALIAHQDLGYSPEKSTLIHNGFDTDMFKPHPSRGKQMRQAFSIPSNALVIGHVGRFNQTKNQFGFLQAARLISHQYPQAVFVMCGSGVDQDNQQLRGWIRDFGLSDQIRLLGLQTNMPVVYAMFDMLVSSSLSEALPNVIGEASACGIPCVVTDAGDSAFLVENTGLVVPLDNVEKLVQGIINLIENDSLRKSMGVSARQHILKHFSIEKMVTQTLMIYNEVLCNK